MLMKNRAARVAAPCALALFLPFAAFAATPQTFDTDPVLSNVQAPGTWYTDRFAPGAFESEPFDGDNRLLHGIRTAQAAANRPPAYASSFYNTQGRKYDTNATGPEQTFTIDVYVGSDCETEDRSFGLWATGFNAANVVSAYPIIQYRHKGNSPIWGTGTADAGFYGWSYVSPGGYPFFMPVTEFDRWYTLSFTLTVGVGVDYYVDGVHLGFIADVNTVSLGNVILNAYNYGDENYDVYWDNFVVGDLTVAIDVRPNNTSNQVNATSKQLVPIAILSLSYFDATTVDPESVSVRGASPLATKVDYEDVNSDGLDDIVLYFRARDFDPPTEAECSDPDATMWLDGATTTGKLFSGSDGVTWLGC